MELSTLAVEDFKIGQPSTSIYDDAFITKVVFDGTEDDLKINKWCIVFGNSLQVDERVSTVIEKYREGRFERIILCGGTEGISNLDNIAESEASRYKKKLLAAGIPESCIYLDETSKNTFENIRNAMQIIAIQDGQVDSLSIITSEYHLKRCALAFKKGYPQVSVTTIPAYDGYSDRDNWFKSSNEWNTGRCRVIWERNLLTRYALSGQIEDCEIENKNRKIN